MKHIFVLEPQVANKIAAGEVVDRPASIVKELVENSLDAGATAITVEIRGGGVDYIRITDNGSGIPEEDVPTAFLRHATSKLKTAEELESISSFGFRGEALASIAAVSKVSMRTRTSDGDYGICCSIEGGVQISNEPCACPIGTTIEVNELFYNVPARLKFIKSQRTEAAMITDYVTRLMLANTEVSIKLISNGKTLLHTTGGGDLASNILAVYGTGVFASLYQTAYDDGYISVTGFVGGESIARSNRIQQSVFINGRYVKSPLISNAVQRAFLTRLMNHRFPFFVLNILIASREVDVNVHPNKLSVRFRDEERVANAVTAAVTAALNGKETVVLSGLSSEVPVADAAGKQQPDNVAHDTESLSSEHYRIETEVRELFKKGARTAEKNYADPAETFRMERDRATNRTFNDSSQFEFNDSGAADFPPFSTSKGNGTYFPSLNKVDYNPAQAPLRKYEPKASDQFAGFPVFHTEQGVQEKPTFGYKAEQTSLDADQCTIIGTAFNTYIIVQQGEAIYYIDQHAAHERMMYEKLISGRMKFDSQLLAVPLVLSFDPMSFNCIVENIETFEEFGYSLETNDDRQVSIYAVPNIPGIGAERFLRDAVDCILQNANAAEKDIVRSQIIQMSCKRAVKAGDSLDIRQLKAIVDAYTGDAVPLTCPHGRPVMIRVKKSELQKMFKRII